MGKVFNNGSENDRSHLKSVNRSSSCSDESMQTSLQRNGNSSLSSNISVVNGSCELHEASLVNGNSSNTVSVNGILSVNGHCDSKQMLKNALTIDRSYKDNNVQNAPSISKNSYKFPAKEFSTVNGNNDSNIEKEQLNHALDISKNLTPCTKPDLTDDIDENQNGFIKVVNKRDKSKKRNKEKNKSGLNARSIRCDNKNKTNNEPIPSLTHVVHKPSTANNTSKCNKLRSYSEALKNGRDGNSQKGISSIQNEGQNIAHDQSKEKATNADLLQIHKKHPTVEISHNISSKAQETDCCVQADCQKKSLPSQEKCLPTHESENPEKANSPIDFVEESDCLENPGYVENKDKSSNAVYCDSLASNDSGRGDSEGASEVMSFFCEFPFCDVPALMGKRKHFKRHIELKSGIYLRVHSDKTDPDVAIVQMKGTFAQIEIAKKIIQERFPDVILKQWTPSIPNQYMPSLPMTHFPGLFGCISDPNLFWLQQSGHPLLYQLENLEVRMSLHYNGAVNIPSVYYVEIGDIIAVPAFKIGDGRKWIRATVVEHLPDNQVVVQYLDHGGTYAVPLEDLRPMRAEFFSMKFFAAQCSLYGIVPKDGVWSTEAVNFFTNLCSTNYAPTIHVVDRTPECYLVTVAVYDAVQNVEVDVGEQLILSGFASLDPRSFPQ